MATNDQDDGKSTKAEKVPGTRLIILNAAGLPEMAEEMAPKIAHFVDNACPDEYSAELAQQVIVVKAARARRSIERIDGELQRTKSAVVSLAEVDTQSKMLESLRSERASLETWLSINEPPKATPTETPDAISERVAQRGFALEETVDTAPPQLLPEDSLPSLPELLLASTQTSSTEDPVPVRSTTPDMAVLDVNPRIALRKMVEQNVHPKDGARGATFKSKTWWETRYDIFDMAQNIGARLQEQGKRHSNTEISKQIEITINNIERSRATGRTSPNWDTIRGRLNEWKWKPE